MDGERPIHNLWPVSLFLFLVQVFYPDPWSFSLAQIRFVLFCLLIPDPCSLTSPALLLVLFWGWSPAAGGVTKPQSGSLVFVGQRERDAPEQRFEEAPARSMDDTSRLMTEHGGSVDETHTGQSETSSHRNV